MSRLFKELKRRSVFRVAAVYAVVAWAVIEVSNVVLPRLGLPPWTVTLVIALAALGFPLALVVAWAFEMSPEGVRRTPAGEGVGERAAPLGVAARGWAVVAVAAVAAAAGGWYLAGRGAGPAAEEGAAGAGEAGAAADATSAGTGVAPAGRIEAPRLAVLPFEDIARGSGEAFFAAGMHEEVLDQLSKVESLQVISRTSVRQYAGTDKTVAEISRELGELDAILEGSVRRAGDRVRITTQLIDADRDAHLWSETYDRELSTEAIFEIQADIASRIAGALEARFTAREDRRIRSPPTADLAAYDAYLQGRSEWLQYWGCRDPVHVDRSVERLREAVRRDSAFAEAHGWLALAYWARAEVSGDRRWVDSASVAAERGVVLDPRSGTGHLARAVVLSARDSADAAERSARRALELQPSNAGAANFLSDVHESRDDRVGKIRWVHRAARLDPRRWAHAGELSAALAGIGMLDAAEAWARRARELAPGALGPVRDLVRVQLDRGEVAAARATVEAFREERPDHFGGLSLAGEVAVHAGELRQAKTYLERVTEARRRDFPERSPTRPEEITLELGDRVHLGLAELGLGNREAGRELVEGSVEILRERLEEEPDPRASVHANLAGVLGTLGRTEEALRQLERAVAAGYPSVAFLRRHPAFEPLRQEPRFREALRGAEANRRRLQEEVRGLGLDLEPPALGDGG